MILEPSKTLGQKIDFRKKIISCSSLESTIRMNWHLLDWCNYQCKYCRAGNAITKDFADKERITKQYKLILARLNLIDTTFDLCIGGGEPTLHPNLKEIIEGLNENKNLRNIFLFTNFSRSKNFYQELIKITDKLVVHASYHPEYYTKEFLDKCLELKFEVHVSLIDEEKYWDQTEDFIKSLVTHNVPYRLNVLSSAPNWKPNYNENFWKRFKKYAIEDYTLDLIVTWSDETYNFVSEYDLEENSLNRFKGWKCTPQSYQIEMNGTIRNICTGKIMPLNLNGKSIIEDVFCPLEACQGARLMYTKRRVDE
jgi:organic radical activating enzyme